MVVAGCGVLALVLSTIGVYGTNADARQIRMTAQPHASKWVSETCQWLT